MSDFPLPKLPDFTEAVLSLRNWERTEIPFFSPQISLDVLLHVSAAALRNELAKVKDVHLAIGHSQDRIREVMKQLADNDWIELLPNARDGRSRIVVPTDKSLNLLDNYRKRLISELTDKNASTLTDEETKSW